MIPEEKRLVFVRFYLFTTTAAQLEELRFQVSEGFFWPCGAGDDSNSEGRTILKDEGWLNDG